MHLFKTLPSLYLIVSLKSILNFKKNFFYKQYRRQTCIKPQGFVQMSRLTSPRTGAKYKIILAKCNRFLFNSVFLNHSLFPMCSRLPRGNRSFLHAFIVIKMLSIIYQTHRSLDHSSVVVLTLLKTGLIARVTFGALLCLTVGRR